MVKVGPGLCRLISNCWKGKEKAAGFNSGFFKLQNNGVKFLQHGDISSHYANFLKAIS